MGFVRAYQDGDELSLAPRLRAADLAEIQAITDRPPADMLREGAEQSAPSCTIVGDGENVVGMFGVIPDAEDEEYGRVWLLGSDELVQAPLRRQFLRQCHSYLHVLGLPYAHIGNFIDARNTVHIRWLKWMGFTVIQRPLIFGVQRHTFLEFIKPCGEELEVSPDTRVFTNRIEEG